MEHFKPKSRYVEDAYEWSNYRYVCSTLNGRKWAHEDVLDPFTLPPGTFALTLDLMVVPAQGCAPGLRTRAVDTINRLKLNSSDCQRLRENCWHSFISRKVTAAFLEEYSPFVYSEMVRLGQLDGSLRGLRP